jgi:hypothetical protein
MNKDWISSGNNCTSICPGRLARIFRASPILIRGLLSCCHIFSSQIKNRDNREAIPARRRKKKRIFIL